MILGLDEPSTYAHHSDEETFSGTSMRDYEGIDSARHVAISPDQDERTGHDDWFSDDSKNLLKLSLLLLQLDNLTSMSRRKKFPRRRGLLVT